MFDSGHNMDDSSVTGSQAEAATALKVTGSSNADIIKLLENINTKITHMDVRLDSLDKLDQKVSNVENELVKLWNVVHDNNKTLQNSMNKVSDKVDSIEMSLAQAHSQISELKREKDEIKSALNYVQAQSMRNNLIFSRIKEPKLETAEESETVLRTFLIEKLKLAKDCVDRLQFERVHRMGSYPGLNAAKPRGIVAKFTFYRDRETVRRSSSALKGTGFYINEQFPKDVADKRRALQSQMRSARSAGKRAWISFDTLYVDGVPVRSPTESSAASGSRRDMA